MLSEYVGKTAFKVRVVSDQKEINGKIQRIVPGNFYNVDFAKHPPVNEGWFGQSSAECWIIVNTDIWHTAIPYATVGMAWLFWKKVWIRDEAGHEI